MFGMLSGVLSRGVYCPGSVQSMGVVCAVWNAVRRGQVCYPGVCVCTVGGGGVVQGVLLPSDLSHHAFDVTCLLSLHQLRMNTSEAAYIVLLGHVTCHWPLA